MRILGERAVPVDAKAIPYDPRNLLEWNRRMRIVKRFYNRTEKPDWQKLLPLGPNYIVFDKRKSQTPTGPVIYENRRFVVTTTPETLP